MNTIKDETNELITIINKIDISTIPPIPPISPILELQSIPYTISIKEGIKPTYTPCYTCVISSSDTSDTHTTSDTSDTHTTSDSSDTHTTSDTSDTHTTSDNDTSSDNENTTNDNNDINVEHPLYMIYNESKEINEEIQLLNYHKNKDCGYWKIAKMIIAHSTKDKSNTEFFLDSLDIELQKNNDKLENIEKVFYTNNLDVDIVYEFEGSIAMFIVENLKLFKFRPLGYVFNKDVNQNKWEFTISVITSKSIYTSNRYISETQIGFY
jgi:hypothetical protein